MEKIKKTIIIGGVAGGASCAARLRRLNEFDQIVMIERGPYISFANCGLPYHISGVIENKSDLVVTSVDDFSQRFSVDTRIYTEAVSIDRNLKSVKLKNLITGEIYSEEYDFLVLSPGAEPIRPNIPGSNLDNIFVLRNIPNLEKIMSKLQSGLVKHVSVIGAGFIGLEVSENLVERGLKVSLIEKSPQVMPLMDSEISNFIQTELSEHGVQVFTSTEITKIEKHFEQLQLTDDKGNKINTDLVLFCIGIKPEIQLAQDAGLKIGAFGGIQVDKSFRTEDPFIFAVGDAIETFDKKNKFTLRLPLAGPANRQGRIVAENICGQKIEYKGTLGTSIVKIFSLSAGSVGLTEKSALRLGINYQAVWVESKSHASYYPGSVPLIIKVLFSPENGELLGAQAIGKKGVDKRIDVLATAIYGNFTVYDLESLDLAYAPSFSSAKDPVNMVGMVASNILKGLHPSVRLEDVQSELDKGALLLDVREPQEFKMGCLPNAQSIPLSQLRKEINKILLILTFFMNIKKVFISENENF